jgi:cyclopropane fatty-acyl-phospholipid synthase-like methyltransferase
MTLVKRALLIAPVLFSCVPVSLMLPILRFHVALFGSSPFLSMLQKRSRPFNNREGLIIKQWIQDWDAKFRGGYTPWEDDEPSEIMEDLFRTHIPEGSTIFEIGCGLGVNAMRLASMGYDVTATDVSPEAVRITLESARRNALPLTCGRFDVENDDAPERKYDVVFDKGCLHSFATHEGRLNFARKVHDILNPAGLWINISGSADNDDDPAEVEKFGYPRLTLSQLAEAVETYFEVVEIKRCWYGKLPSTSFKAWASVMQKRAIKFKGLINGILQPQS